MPPPAPPSDQKGKAEDAQRAQMTFGFMSEAGTPGLKQSGGFLVEEWDPNLRGQRGMKMFREMSDTHPVIGAFLWAIKQALVGCEWRIDPADATPKAKAEAEFFLSLKDDMEHSWSEFILEALTMLEYGFAPVEMVLKPRLGVIPNSRLSSKFDDGRIGVRKLALRAQDTVQRWLIDDATGDILGFVQQPYTGQVVSIPIAKVLHFRTTKIKNNPEGRSLLRNCYRNYYYSKRITEIEAVGLERDLAGLPVMYIPSLITQAAQGGDAASAAVLSAYKNMIRNVRRNEQEGVLLPSDRDDKGNRLYEMTLLSSGGRRNFDTNAIITRHNQEIAVTVLADFLLMGHRSGGGQALGQGKIEFFLEAVQALLNNLKDTVNRQLVPVIGEVNGIDPKLWPTFRPDLAEDVDLGRVGAYVNALAASGMPLFPDSELESYLRRIASFPEASLDQGVEILGGALPQADPNAGKPGGFGGPRPAGGAPPASNSGGAGAPPSGASRAAPSAGRGVAAPAGPVNR